MPVVVRETEHPHQAYFPDAVEVKRAAAGDALPSALRLVSAAPHAVPVASTKIELASPWTPPSRTVWPSALSFAIKSAEAPRSIVTVSGSHW